MFCNTPFQSFSFLFFSPSFPLCFPTVPLPGFVFSELHCFVLTVKVGLLAMTSCKVWFMKCCSYSLCPCKMSEWNSYLATHFHQNSCTHRLSDHIWIRNELLPSSGMNLLKYITSVRWRWKYQFWGQNSLVRLILVDEENDDCNLWTGCRLASKLLALIFPLR